MTRKAVRPFDNPWLSQLDSVEKKLMNAVPAHRQAFSVDTRPHVWLQCNQDTEQVLHQLTQHSDDLSQDANGWLQAGWLSQQSREDGQQLQQPGKWLQTASGNNMSQIEEYQRLVGQLMPTLKRINQRRNMQSFQPVCSRITKEDPVEVALRVAMKRRAPLLKQ